MRRIKLKIAGFNRAIAVQILELTGNFNSSEHVKFNKGVDTLLYNSAIVLNNQFNDVCIKYFQDNLERDIYINTIVHWITTEQFNSNIEVKPGDLCYASDDSVTWYEAIYMSNLPKKITQSPKNIIVHNTVTGALEYTTYIKPTCNNLFPKIKNEVYTWEA
jgi:hypothetical protein